MSCRLYALALVLLLSGLGALHHASSQTLPLLGAGKGAVSVATAVTWDVAHTDSAITLSNGNLTAAIAPSDSSNYLSRATAGVPASSKVYWEVACGLCPNFANAIGLGVADSSFTIPQNNYLGSDSDAIGYYGSAGSVFTGGSQVTSWESWATDANVVAFALDTVNGKMWARLNGGFGWNNDVIGNQNPATNTGGLSISLTAPLYPAVVFRAGSGLSFQVTGHFSSGSWTGTAPAGFTQL